MLLSLEISRCRDTCEGLFIISAYIGHLQRPRSLAGAPAVLRVILTFMLDWTTICGPDELVLNAAPHPLLYVYADLSLILSRDGRAPTPHSRGWKTLWNTVPLNVTHYSCMFVTHEPDGFSLSAGGGGGSGEAFNPPLGVSDYRHLKWQIQLHLYWHLKNTRR